MFKLWLLLARMGWFSYEGSWSHAPDWWPKARVHYPSGHYSAAMAIGNAVEYQMIYGGQVVPPNEVFSGASRRSQK